jgi:NADH-quinone oxidoreductase subunit N
VSIPGAFTSAVLTVGLVATLGLGIVPTPVLDLADKAATFLRG